MKNYYKGLLAVVAVTVLMLALNSCITSAEKAKSETQNKVYIPSFPDPVDKDGNYIVEFNEDYTKVEMPFWYWMQITNYAIEVENAAQSLQ